MSLNADALAYLLAQGFTAEQMVEFARIAERKKDATGAERQARYREKRKGKVTRDSNGVTPPIEEIIPPEQSSPDGEACIPKTRVKPMIALAEGWEPILTPAAQRIVDGWPPGMFDRQLSAFRNHAADKGRKSKDWQAAFRTWIDNADKWKSRDDRASNHTWNRSQPGADSRSSLARAIDEGLAGLGP